MVDKDKIVCSGCGACASICPQNCIKMSPDSEGFLYPQIDKTICIQCGKCEKVCQAINPLQNNSQVKAYAAYIKDDSVRLASSSGGIFTALAEFIIDSGGVVFGAAFDDDFSVHHICIQRKDDVEKIRGSKYVQSKIADSYTEAKKILDSGIKVLFTGTPCQIDGLIHYLGKDYSNLYTQDIVCHGVPSLLVWRKYLEYRRKVCGRDLDYTKAPQFRNKEYGWQQFSLKLHYKGNRIYLKKFYDDLYLKAFLRNICLRPSCYECKSKSLNRNSDITLADFWGIEKIDQSMFDNHGTSLILVNTDKGSELLDKIGEKLVIKECDTQKAAFDNTAAYKSVSLNPARKAFMENVRVKEFDDAYWLALKKQCGIRESLHILCGKFRRAFHR